MQIELRASNKSGRPSGLLVKGSSPLLWLEALGKMQLALTEVSVFPIPNTSPNSVWGSLIVWKTNWHPKPIDLHEFCQLIEGKIFIPQNAKIYPPTVEGELKEILNQNLHLFHPEFGLVELMEEVPWADLLEFPEAQPLSFAKPLDIMSPPSRINSFEVVAPPLDEVIERMEKQQKHEPKPIDSKPLNFFEKAKLTFYREYFHPNASEADRASWKNNPDKELEDAQKNRGGMEKWDDKMFNDYEKLLQRNQKALDKLLDMFKKNPEDALKYAIPLDEKGTGRGRDFSGDGANFGLSKLWSSLSWMADGLAGVGGGGSFSSDDYYHKLRKEYHDTAKDFIAKGDYQKAAFIYMKLLKEPRTAANTLRDGGYYQEAASIYLKHLNDTRTAADCYKEGYFYKEAIELYKELNENEIVGDLYMELQQVDNAHIYYEKVAQEFLSKGKSVQASLIYRKKMNTPERGQEALMQGWRKGIDAFNCLNNYFENIEDEEKLWEAMQIVETQEVNNGNIRTFIKVLQHEYRKRKEMNSHIRDMAYEIISQQLPSTSHIADELLHFNPHDDELVKDVVRYRNRG